MTWFDRIFLLLAGLVAIYVIHTLVRRKKVDGEISTANAFHMTALTVLFVSGVLLILFGWEILGLMGSSVSNRLVAIVATLIPFCWATGIVAGSYKQAWKWYAGFMAVGLVLIVVSRFMDLPLFSRIVYPVFHGIAGLTIVILPLVSVIRRQMNPSYALVSLGGFLISVGGMSLAFLMSGRQLLFLSIDVVLAILAPLLFLMALTYGLGLILGNK